MICYAMVWLYAYVYLHTSNMYICIYTYVHIYIYIYITNPGGARGTARAAAPADRILIAVVAKWVAGHPPPIPDVLTKHHFDTYNIH